MGIFSFLEKLKNTGGTGGQTAIGVYISPKSILEVVEIECSSGKILKYGSVDMPYDLVGRQIAQVSLLELRLQKIFTDLQIPPKSNVILSMPSVMTGFITLPTDLQHDEIITALESEAERNYIFRKYEPCVSYEQIVADEQAASQYIIYSAVQKEQINAIIEVFKNLDLNITAIDSSYAALVRGLSVTNIIDEDINNEKPICCLLITPNSFVILSLIGDKIVDIAEEPLAVKSFNPDDIYPNLASYSIEGIQGKNPEHIVFISESNDVSAEVLSSYLDLECKVSFVECNKFNKKPLFIADSTVITEDLVTISLETAGSACWQPESNAVHFNYIQKSKARKRIGFQLRLGNKSIVFNQKTIEYFMLGIIVFSFIALTATYFICVSVKGGLEKTLSDNYKKKEELEKLLEKQKQAQPTNIVTPSQVVSNVHDTNQKMLESYNAIGEVIPEKLWIDSFSLNDDMTVSIKGRAYNVEDIINFYQNLSKIAKYANFKITSIKVGGQGGPTDARFLRGLPSGLRSSSSLPDLNSIPGLLPEKYYDFSFDSKTAAPPPPTSQAAPVDPNAPAEPQAGSPGSQPQPVPPQSGMVPPQSPSGAAPGALPPPPTP